MSGFDEPYWNALQLLSWVSLGDRGLVARCALSDEQTDRSYWAEEMLTDETGAATRQLVQMPAKKPSTIILALYAAAKNDRMRPPHFDQIATAENEIYRKLQEGILSASGKFHEGQRRDISSLEWLDLRVDYDLNAAAHKSSPFAAYADLKFPRAQILQIWPDLLSDLQAEETADGPLASAKSPDEKLSLRAAYEARVAEFRGRGDIPPLQTTKTGILGDREWATQHRVPRAQVQSWRADLLPSPKRGRRPNNSSGK